MVTRKLSSSERAFLKRLGKRVEGIILSEMGYSSLDAFSLANHDRIAKPTLYQICAGERDMKITTLIRLTASLGISAASLLEDVEP